MTSVVLAGCGAMGFAMLKGWRDAANAPEVHVVEPDEALRTRAAGTGAVAHESAADLAGSLTPALVFFAVKPQNMAAAAPAYGRFAASGATYISIAAGVSLSRLEGLIGEGAAIIRCMPNTPASIGAGMIVCCANGAVGASARAQAEGLLAACGTVAWVEREALMDAVTAISGSGPAYVFYFIECLAAAAEKLGIPADLAVRLARHTVAGAGRLAATEEDIQALRRQVTSTGGATAAAFEVLMEGDAFARLVESAAIAARDRSAKLGES